MVDFKPPPPPTLPLKLPLGPMSRLSSPRWKSKKTFFSMNVVPFEAVYIEENDPDEFEKKKSKISLPEQKNVNFIFRNFGRVLRSPVTWWEIFSSWKEPEWSKIKKDDGFEELSPSPIAWYTFVGQKIDFSIFSIFFFSRVPCVAWQKYDHKSKTQKWL